MPKRNSKAPQPRRNVPVKQWLFRFTALFLGPLLFLLTVEVVLRLVGYGHSTRFLQPLEDTDDLVANPYYCRPFFARNVVKAPHPFRMPRIKPNDTKRIFIMGGSAAAGTPDPSFGFARILERMVRLQSVTHDWEFINLAIRGINSHVIRPMAREVALQDPDLVVIYLGNNELVGAYAPSPGGFNLTDRPNLIRLSQWAKSQRLGQWLVDVVIGSAGRESETQDMAFFRSHRFRANDPLRSAVYENFEVNLTEILTEFRRRGVPVLLSTVAVNLQDCPPLGSLHRADLTDAELRSWLEARETGLSLARSNDFASALEAFKRAEGMDGEYAEIHYLIGRSYVALGMTNETVQAFQKACDWDALPFRADSGINRVIRGLSGHADGKSLIFLDAEKEFLKRGIPGNDLFHEHVHFNFQGDYLLAGFIFDKLRGVFPEGFPREENGASLEKPSMVECARHLALTLFEQTGLFEAIVALKASPPFLDQWEHESHQKALDAELERRWRSYGPDQMQQTLQVYEFALGRWPDDWMLKFNFGNFLDRTRQYEDAGRYFGLAADAMPHFKEAQVLAARALVSAGKQQEAVPYVKRALIADPRFQAALDARDYLQNQGLWR